MDQTTFKRFISNYVFLPEQDWEAIAKEIKAKTYPKGSLLLQAGNICNTFSFLETGLLRFSVLKDGEDVTKFFTVAPYAFTSQYSFSNRLPSRENIEALEESLIWEVSYESSNQLLRLNSWNTFVRKLIQEVQYFTEQILEDAQNETAEKRYIDLITNRPELIRRVSLKHLASFLGVTPQSLSRIRRKIGS